MAADPVILDCRNTQVQVDAVRALDDSSVRQEADSGRVIVIERWARPRRRWVVSYDWESARTIETLFAANRRRYTFLFVAPNDSENSQDGHWFASGDGVTDRFQLTGNLGSTADPDGNDVRGTGFDIFYPLPLSNPEVGISSNGTPLDQDTDYAIEDRGIVHFLAGPPALGVILTCTITYAFPVRFYSESVEVQMKTHDGIDIINQITLEEDFEDAED